MNETDAVRYEMFRDIGRDIFLAHMISSHGGNMSVREGDDIYITRTGSQLGRLKETDIVRVSYAGTSALDACASSELVVHRAIYHATDARAVVHAHSLHTVFRSMIDDIIKPLDSEARLFIPEVPVLTSKTTIGSPTAAGLIAEALARNPIAVLRGHGPFACAQSLDDAYRWISVLEGSCQLLDMADKSPRELKDYLDF